MSDSAQVVVAVGVLILFIGVAIAVVRYARTIKLTVGKVEAEFHPNGGGSLRDSIDTLTNKVDLHFAELFAKVNDHEARITKLEKPPRAPRKKAS